ncbi:MAG: hypothetical protein ACK5LO_11280 [Leucobacter sp.]
MRVSSDTLRFSDGLVELVSGILLIGAGAVAMLPPDDLYDSRLAARWAWCAVAAAALAQLVMTWNTGSGPGEGYATWGVRGATIVCAAVLLRGRAGAAWAGALVGYAGDGIIGVATGDPIGLWIVLILRQIASMLAIQIFAILLERNRRAVTALQEEERAALMAIQVREAIGRQRRLESERIRDQAVPILRRIAAGEASEELRREAKLVEGSLRDMLRGRRLAVGPVPDSARAARARGVDVVLLDDLGGELGIRHGRVPSAVSNWVAERLSEVEPPRATVRLAAGTDGDLTVSFYAENPGDAPEFLTIDPA